jgi:hypothetical protein
MQSFLKFVTALHVSAYSAIIRCAEIRGNSCAFRATAICVFAFTLFLNEVSSPNSNAPDDCSAVTDFKGTEF